VEEAGVGCHIALDVTTSTWMLGTEVIDMDEYSADVKFPDVAIDYEDDDSDGASDDWRDDEGEGAELARDDGWRNAPRISVTNATGSEGDAVKVAYVTVYDKQCYGKNNVELIQGTSVDAHGRKSTVTTFIALVPPNSLARLCRLRLENDEDVRSVRIESDVRAWSMHPAPHDTHSRAVGFPLQGEKFLCTQSEGGELTHFFSGNLHAVDFRCDVGTPVLAVGDGEVIEVTDSNTLTGIAVGNLFKWNSIVLKLDTNEEEWSERARDAVAECSTTVDADTNVNDAAEDAFETEARSLYDVRGGDLYVEYVHIQHKSAKVKVGDRVKRGQVLCASGSVGFSPEPHLHFTAFRSSEATANTVRVLFEPSRDRSATYIPRAGAYYNENGRVR
jgi:murein DD-endopeptidase MepM/ murein hydrolase activator NlpD